MKYNSNVNFNKLFIDIDSESIKNYVFSLNDKNIYKMWFSFKSGIKKNDKYKLGYAESEDGITWRRIDSEVGITMSKTGWDSEMIEYASVIKYENEYFMFYNGNKYGYDGIGLAIAKNVN